MEDFLLHAEHVSKRYAGHTALDDVSISVPRGSVYGLLGPNGAGKTTLIRIINRITAPDRGAVFFWIRYGYLYVTLCVFPCDGIIS